MYVLNGKILRPGKPFNHKGLQYPGDWLAQSTQEQRNAIGIVTRDTPRTQRKYDSKFYFSFENPRPVEGVKDSLITEVKQQAGSVLSQTDWYVARKAETGEAIPADVANHRLAVRAWSNEVESAILPLETTEEVEAYWKNEKPPCPTL